MISEDQRRYVRDNLHGLQFYDAQQTKYAPAQAEHPVEGWSGQQRTQEYETEHAQALMLPQPVSFSGWTERNASTSGEPPKPWSMWSHFQPNPEGGGSLIAPGSTHKDIRRSVKRLAKLRRKLGPHPDADYYL